MNKKLYILLLGTVVMVWSAQSQNIGVEQPTSSAMDHLYPSPERWSGARYSVPAPSFGERLYFTVGGGIFHRWSGQNSLASEGWGIMERASLGYNISPVHSVELGANFTYPLQDGYGDRYTEIEASYLFNVTAFASKRETPTKWELFLKAGVNNAFEADQYAMGFSSALRLKYNISSAIGVYVEPAIAICAYSKNNSYLSPYLNGDIIPSFSIGLSIRPSSIVNSIGGIIDRRNDRLETNGYEVKPLFAIKSNLLYDIASIINIELEVPIRDHYSIAADIICPWWTWDDGTIDSRRDRLQAMNANVEGRYWFGDRTRRSILTGWFAGVFAGGGLYDFEDDGEGYQGEFFIMGGVSGGYSHAINRSRTLRMEYTVGVGYLRTEYRQYTAIYSNDNMWHAVNSSNGVYSWLGPTKVKASLSWLINYKKMGGSRL